MNNNDLGRVPDGTGLSSLRDGAASASPPEASIPSRTFAEHVCTAIYHALVADFGSMHMGVDRLDTMAGPQASLLFFKPLDGPDGGLRYATVCGQSISLAVNDAIRSWHERAAQAPDANTRATQPLSLTVETKDGLPSTPFDVLDWLRDNREAIIDRLQSLSLPVDIDRSGLAQEVE